VRDSTWSTMAPGINETTNCAGCAIADRSFRFCHIDVDAYQSGKDVLSWVWPSLAVGGIVVFDDFGFSSTRGIAALVHEEEAKGSEAGSGLCARP